MDTQFIKYRPIGYVISPFKETENMPVQPSGVVGIQGKIIIDSEFMDGLLDLEGFSHIYLLFHLHEVNDYELTVPPFLDANPHGVFATRSPNRPNPIGLSIVRLLSVEENVLIIENIDMLDGTPVLDIKPFVPVTETQNDVRIGWLTGKTHKINSIRSRQNSSDKDSER